MSAGPCHPSAAQSLLSCGNWPGQAGLQTLQHRVMQKYFLWWPQWLKTWVGG